MHPDLGILVGLALTIFVFAAVVVSMVYTADFERLTGYPRRRPFYVFLLFLLIALIVLLALYEFGLIALGSN